MTTQTFDFGTTPTQNGGNDDYIVTGEDTNYTVTYADGNDQLTLGNGNNTITLGNGRDQVTAGTGNNTVTVGDGNDVIVLGDSVGGETVTTGNGNSTVTIGSGPGSTVTVGTGANTIMVGPGSGDVVHTGGGDNTVSLAAGAVVASDLIQGALTTANGTGNKIIVTTAGAIATTGIAGFDTFQLANGGANSINLIDTNFSRLPGAITVIGGDSGNTLDAAALDATRSIDLVGGAGADTVQLGYAKSAANLTLNADRSLTIGHGTGTDNFSNVEQLNFADSTSLTTSNDPLSTPGDVVGFASVTTAAAYTNIGGRIGGAEVLNLGPPASTLVVHGLLGATTVQGFSAGDTIDLANATATIATVGGVSTVTSGGGTLDLGAAPAGSTFSLIGDAKGGTDVVLTSPPAADAFQFTDVSTSSSGQATGSPYAGAIDYLQQQYISNSADDNAIRANTPNAFLEGSSGADALQVTAGNNVLQGDGGSNFLVGGMGADGGVDSFIVDGSGSAATWNTIVNFHEGDLVTLYGFHAGTSTMPFTASDGAAAYTGLTIHSETGGTGTGVNASLTFAGISQATAGAHFSISAVSAQQGTPSAGDYLLIKYDH